MTDWQLIQSYWLHFYKFQSMLPNSYCQILQEEDLLPRESSLNREEEEEEKITKKGGE